MPAEWWMRGITLELVGAIIAAMTTVGQVSPEPPSPPKAPSFHIIEAGFWAGLFLPSADHELYDSLGTDHRAYSTVNPSFGLRLSYFPIPFLGAEGEGGYMPSPISGGDLGHLFTLRGHGVLQWPMRVTPFVLAGGGLLASSGAPGNDVDRAFHWGVGAKFYIEDWLSVRLDGRQIYTAQRGPGAGNTSHFEILAGVSFTLFRAAPKDEWTVADVGTVRPPPSAPAAAEPEPELAGRDLTVATSTPAVVVRRALERVHFAFGSAKLRPAAFSALDLAADVMRRNPRMRVRIIGHTDHIGSEAFNQRLSEQRADAVRNYLVRAGIDPERLEPVGMGEEYPIAPNNSAAGRAKNRRSEFDIDFGDDDDEPASSPTFPPDDTP